ncbi:hypothetical protein R3P38DRAFT_1766540 [Favolaschia claudopus]|uniref:Uncharacterized protein n=1 Tax=Favolaschia claudopus TaxID=2862362 RepID=A0AAW0DGR7_9AGAR
MPRITLSTSTGRETFSYTISTPTKTSAEKILQGLPTILLIHPVYVTSAIFHPIYADCKLRRFNLVTLDCRGHGKTTASVNESYGKEVAAKDVLSLMVRLLFSAHMRRSSGRDKMTL